MIEFRTAPGGMRHVHQTKPSPIVYLDHGPMRHIADSEAWRGRLVAALRRGGTLALSLVNSMEIGNQGPGPSTDRIRELLDGVGTAFCILDFSAESVAERATASGLAEDDAVLDPQTAESYASSLGWPEAPFNAGPFVPWSMEDLERSRAFVVDTKARLHDALKKMQARHKATGQYPPIERPEFRTLYVRGRLTNELLRQGGPFDENDGLDLQHAAVSLAVCDLVVLDSRWAEFAKRVSPRGRRARVFSGKPRQIELFLDALERFPVSPEVK